MFTLLARLPRRRYVRRGMREMRQSGHQKNYLFAEGGRGMSNHFNDSIRDNIMDDVYSKLK